MFKIISIDIGDASLIGLECESGDFSDCDWSEINDRIPFGCEDILMFSNSNSTCGSKCNVNGFERREIMSRTGWTLFYTNEDNPFGTGDHENFFEFLNGRDRLKVYDLNGEAYTNCEKKAIHIRHRNFTAL